MQFVIFPILYYWISGSELHCLAAITQPYISVPRNAQFSGNFRKFRLLVLPRNPRKWDQASREPLHSEVSTRTHARTHALAQSSAMTADESDMILRTTLSRDLRLAGS